MKSHVQEAALTYAKAGIAVFPCRPSKAPYTPNGFKDATTDPDIIDSIWRADALLGATGFEGIDIDNKIDASGGGIPACDLYATFRSKVETRAPGLMTKLLVEKTMNGGYHLMYRCLVIEGSQKLARRPPTEQEIAEAKEENRKAPPVTLIETKGVGGYFVVAPSPGYTVVQGEWPYLPEITPEERDLLFAVAREADTADAWEMKIAKAAHRKERRPKPEYHGDSVIDRYNKAVTIDEALEKHGYTYGGGNRYIRPGGKNRTVVILDGTHSFHHSTNDILCDGHAHSAFSVFCALSHNDDCGAAVKEAARILGMNHETKNETAPEERNGWYFSPFDGRPLFCGKYGLISFDASGVVSYSFTPEGYNKEEWNKKRKAALQERIQSGTHDPGLVSDTPSFIVPPRLFLASQARKHIPPVQWIVPGVIAKNTLSQLFAPPGAGKSFLALDIALTVAQYLPVVYVAAEAVGELPDRIDAWVAHHGVDTGSLHIYDQSIRLADLNSVESFVSQIQDAKPAVIIIDPLAECLAGLEESKTGDMMIAIESINHIRNATGAGILVIHHTGWATDHERGSSGLRGACRNVLKLKDDDGFLTLSCEKANNGKLFDARFFKREESFNSIVIVPASELSMTRDNGITKNQLEVLKTLGMMQFADGARNVDIVETTGFTRQNVNRVIHALMKKEWIIKDKSSYMLSQRGRDELYAALSKKEIGPKDISGKSTGRFSWEVITDAENTCVNGVCSHSVNGADQTVYKSRYAPIAGFDDEPTVDNDIQHTEATNGSVNGVCNHYVNGAYYMATNQDDDAHTHVDEEPMMNTNISHPEANDTFVNGVCNHYVNGAYYMATNHDGMATNQDNRNTPNTDIPHSEADNTFVNGVVSTSRSAPFTREFGLDTPNDEKSKHDDAADVVGLKKEDFDTSYPSVNGADLHRLQPMATKNGGIEPLPENVNGVVSSGYKDRLQKSSSFVNGVVTHSPLVYKGGVTTPFTENEEGYDTSESQQPRERMSYDDIREQLYLLAPEYEERTGRKYKDINTIPETALIAAYNNLISYLQKKR